MTEGQKKLAIVAVIVVAIVLLFWPKRAGGTTQTDKNGNPINVSIPSLSLPPRDGLVINIPGLPAFTPYAFSPISPCMCNGAAQSSTLQMPAGLSITNVTNMGNSGPNIYNYTPPKPVNDFYGYVMG